MQIIIENNDIKNMDSKVLADMLIMIANGNTATAKNDLLAKEVAAAEAEVKTDVATVPAEEVAGVKAEDIIKAEEPAPAEEAKKPVKKATKAKKVKAEEPAPKAEEVKAAEPAPKAEEVKAAEPAPKAEEADDDEPDFDELDNIEDSEPAPKRTKAEMKKAITAFCNADPKNVKELKEIASGMGYEKVKDMSEDDMAKMLEKAGI